MIPTALTIAGSDPSGGAGIQADLKTFSALKVYGMAVIAALTAQNSVKMRRVTEVSASMLADQIDAVVEDISPLALKTGMLLTATNVEVVASKVRQYALPNLVVDPVTASSSGAVLLNPDAIDKLRHQLIPLAIVVAPNLDEAQILTGRKIHTPDDMEEAALRIHEYGVRNVYIKGGHLAGDAVDVFFDGEQFTRLAHARIEGPDPHGTGCVLSAAMAAYLARGETVASAVRYAKEFVTGAILHALHLGAGRGPCDPLGIV